MFDDKEPSAPPIQDQDAAAKLAPEEVDALRRDGVAIGFDPVLQTWVRLDRVEQRTRPMLSGKSLASAISLRPWDLSDARTYLDLLDDPEVWRYLYETYPDPMTDRLARDLIEIASAPHHIVRAVVHGGQSIGQIRLLPDASGQISELSYWLGRQFWGKGMAKAMVQAALDLGFDGPSAPQRIVAYVHPENIASQKLLRRSGFTQTSDRADGWFAYAIDRP